MSPQIFQTPYISAFYSDLLPKLFRPPLPEFQTSPSRRKIFTPPPLNFRPPPPRDVSWKLHLMCPEIKTRGPWAPRTVSDSPTECPEIKTSKVWAPQDPGPCPTVQNSSPDIIVYKNNVDAVNNSPNNEYTCHRTQGGHPADRVQRGGRLPGVTQSSRVGWETIDKCQWENQWKI